MATAIMILTNDGGRDAVTTIAASREEAREVVGIAKRATGSKFLPPSSMAAPILMSEAWDAVAKAWERDFCDPKIVSESR